jgi:hypothetical protein
LSFCFNDVIQQDLDFVKMHWNTHYIRRSRFVFSKLVCVFKIGLCSDTYGPP